MNITKADILKVIEIREADADCEEFAAHLYEALGDGEVNPDILLPELTLDLVLGLGCSWETAARFYAAMYDYALMQGM